MPSRFTITTPIPTAEETAESLGVSPSRLKELIQIADEIMDRGPATKKRASASRKRAPGSRSLKARNLPAK